MVAGEVVCRFWGTCEVPEGERLGNYCRFFPARCPHYKSIWADLNPKLSGKNKVR